MQKFIVKRLFSTWKRGDKLKSLTGLFCYRIGRNVIREKMCVFYNNSLPIKFVRHRKYFSEDRRGFGEDAFHSMWFLLFSEFRPINCLEIGVYRGQTLTLWQLLAKHFNYKGYFAGISPFSSIGDSVSIYPEEIDYLSDTKKNHDYFKLEHPDYVIDYSTGLVAQNFINSKKWDLVYIDGSHDYDVVCQDFEISLRNLVKGGIIVMDDSSLYYDFDPPPGSFAGHPGPSMVAKEVAQNKMKLLGGVGHNNIFIKC